MDNETKKLLKEISDSIAMCWCALWTIEITLFVMTMVLIIAL